jgi:hypothetical protein
MATLVTLFMIVALFGPVLMVPVLLIAYVLTEQINYFPPSKDTLELPEHTETSWNNTLSHQPEHMNKVITCKRGCCEYTVRGR